MRRRQGAATTVWVLGMVLWLATPALAKGENGTVTISGPGLAAPIELRHDDAILWFQASGAWEPKWPDPVVDGQMRSSVDLGAAYQVEARFGPECPGVVHQTIYPFAAGGPQVLMGANQHLCGGHALPAGYFPPPRKLIHALVANGFPAREATVSSIDPDAAVATTDGADARPVAAGVAAAVVIGAGGALLVRRRRRHTSRG